MVLFINGCPRKESRTKRLADALLEKIEINLYETELYPVDESRLNKRNALLLAGQLGSEEFRLSRQFAAADEIVVAVPFWDLSFPAKLKLYIENIYITGIVSCYDETGRPEGLCHGKRLYYVTTSGGPYDGRYSFDYMKALCTGYFGIPEVNLIKAELLDIAGNDPEKILSEAIHGIKIS